ncbi:MAG TPA: FKBP-type peptidyl-prolyl cis-trans isomerase [Anaeromyxobacteraceae bacterium]|nr:FKBP-type peptidyl-prolyl cis-trans isomerase [Anaeromyxobacteraceae bacterium]
MTAVRTLAVLLALALPSAARPQGGGKADPRALRALGLSVAKQLEPFSLSAPELEQVLKGIRDGATGKASYDPATMQGSIAELYRARSAAAADRAAAAARKAAGEASAAGAAHLERAARAPGAQRTPSGLVFVSLREGSGPSPAATDKVKVHYRGTLTDGKEFDSSYARGEPAEFPLNGVVACWTEGLQKMKVGGKARLVCPAAIAYGERGRPPVIPGNAVLTFEVELLAIAK